MTNENQTLLNLQQALGDPTASLAVKTSAVEETITIVDQQVYNIISSKINGGFEGGDMMQKGLAAIQESVKPWPDVKLNIRTALKAIKADGPSINSQVNSCIENRSSILIMVYVKKINSTVELLNKQLQQAMDKLHDFSNNLDSAYSAHVNEGQTVSVKINYEKEELDRKLRKFYEKLQEIHSPSSSIVSVISLGVKPIMDSIDINNQINECNNLRNRITSEESAYKLAWSKFMITRNAAVLTSYALTGLNTILQQYYNKLEDLFIDESPNLETMVTYLKILQQEYNEAVSRINE